ncbi:glycosyltransferase involved in cell wall biosynthesis [Actinomadura coerulea]|uniref:Glycosyltransferase involved in cell wall biosynthesis n=1 Tax=Actinomadura coerulea TaxID=46159 RepID=A0A7X0FYA6_9ACTN|nr:glycosyltransferase family 4 protein [Actinomadura coerulea]MBB6395332.1 glycosyltransferase involved in cell wall biosynthesis [Actinomadura coerulea]GGQ35386.1 glycosyl transferase [Actinomadura coerulea]
MSDRQDLDGLRVALVLGTAAGGVGRHVRSVADGLVERGARVVVCGPAATGELFGFAAGGARFAEVDLADRPRPASDARAVARLRRLLRDADVVHAHGLRAGALAVAACARVVPGPLRLGRGGPPLVVTLHNAVITGGRTAAVYGVLERVVARGATRVLGVSPDLEERMRALGARSVGHAIVPAPAPQAPPGPAVRADLRAEFGAGERPLVVAVGRLAEQKGLPTLLDAAAGWAGRTPPPLVAIAGDGPLEGALRARIEAEDLPVRLLGRRSDVAGLLAACDVAVVPSVWEGQPLIVQEILRAGRPLVATRVGGIPGMVGAEERGEGASLLQGPESDAALLVPPNDAEALGRAVSRVLDDPALAARLGSAAARRSAMLPGEDDAVDQLAELYLELTGP